MIAPRGRLASAALTCVVAIASSACNAVFGLGPIEGSTGGNGAPGGGTCASGILSITDVSQSDIPSFDIDLADMAVSVAARYDAMADQSSFTISTLKVPKLLCSAALTVVVAGEPVAGKMYKVISRESDLSFGLDTAWAKLDVDADASCHGPGSWQPQDGIGGPMTIETFDGKIIKLKLSAVQLAGVENASGWVNVDGTVQSSCFVAP